MKIFEFSEVSPFLRHYVSNLPRKGHGEVTRVARFLRVSTTLVSQVFAGRKSFTPEQAQRLSAYLGFTNLEADYFTFMIQKDRAGSSDLKKYWSAKLKELRDESLKVSKRVRVDRVMNDTERAVFYSTPLYSAVRLYSSTEEKGVTLDQVSARFEIARAKAAEMMKFLVETGLCTDDAGRFKMGSQKTHVEFGSPHLLKHLSNWRVRAIRASEDLTPQELMYTAPVSLSKKDFDRLREEMMGFIDSFLKTVHASPAEEIACFNMDFFWIRK